MPELPNAREAERALLAHALRPEGMQLIKAVRVTSDDFYAPAAKCLMATLEQMDRERLPIGRPTIIDKLRSLNRLEMAGGLENLDDLTNYPLVAPDVLRASAAEVIDASVRRQVIVDAVKMQADAYDSAKPLNEVLGAAENTAAHWRRTHNVSATTASFMDSFEMRLVNTLLGNEEDAYRLGLPSLDRRVGHIPPNSYVVLAARPGNGKSSFLRFIAHRMAVAPSQEYRKGFVLFSIEESGEQWAYNAIALETGIWKQYLIESRLAQKLTPAQHHLIQAAADKYRNAPIYIKPISNLNVYDIPSIVRQCDIECRQTHGVPIGGVGLDYLQLLRLYGKRPEKRADEVAEISRELNSQKSADQVGVPYFVAAQLNRVSESERREPALHDLGESGQVERDATLAIFPFRPKDITNDTLRSFPQNLDRDRNLRSKPPVVPVVFKIEKNREGGSAPDRVEAGWNKATGLYFDIDRDVVE